MSVIKNPSFEDEGNGGPGSADLWTHNTSGALGFTYAAYHVETVPPNGAYTPWEWFESGWDNDDGWLHLLSQTGVTYYAIDPEAFTDWPGYDMEWQEAFADADLALAQYGTEQVPPSVGTQYLDVERFDGEWDNAERPLDEYLYTYLNAHLGAPPTWQDPADGVYKFVVSSSNKLRLWLGRFAGAVWSIFEDTIEVTPGTYTTAALRVELQAKTDAALVGAGFAAGNITWDVDLHGGVRCRNNLSGYYLRLREPTGGSAWTAIGFTLYDTSWYGGAAERSTHAVGYKEIDLSLALYDGSTLDAEWFEFGWQNSVTEYWYAAVNWIDGDETSTMTIQAGVNDQAYIMLDDHGGNATVLLCVLTPGAYNVAAMVVELQAQIDAWLVAAGAPFAVGDVVVQVAPGGGIRIVDTGAVVVFCDMYLWRTATSAWPTLGINVQAPYGPVISVDPHTRRISDEKFWTLAIYGGPVSYEDFSDPGWPPLA